MKNEFQWVSWIDTVIIYLKSQLKIKEVDSILADLKLLFEELPNDNIYNLSEVIKEKINILQQEIDIAKQTLNERKYNLTQIYSLLESTDDFFSTRIEEYYEIIVSYQDNFIDNQKKYEQLETEKAILLFLNNMLAWVSSEKQYLLH